MVTDIAPSPEKKVIRISRFQIGLNVVIQFILLLALVVMANYLSFNHFKRWDFSRNQKYLLGAQTKQLLGSLKKPVKAVIYFSSAQDIYGDVDALLREYEYASKKKLTKEVVDPYRNFSRARELAATYKIQERDNIVILDYDGRSKFVNAQDMAEMDNSGMMFGQPPQVKGFKGEQAITSALLELTEEKPNKLYVLAGHGEPELTPAPAPAATAGGTGAIEGLKTYIGRQNIKAETLNLSTTDKVPDDARALLLLGPKYDFSEREMKMLREYWDKKGRVFILLDPAHATSRLNAFLAENGVLPQDDRVLRVVQLGPIQGIVRDVTAVVRPGSAATKGLEGVEIQFLGQTQSLGIDQAAAQTVQATATSLIEAAEGFWGETNYRGGENSPVALDKNDHSAPLTLAVGVEKGAVSGVNVDTARMIVVGNAEFLKDDALTEAGLDFALSGLNWLLNREELIGVAPKERKTFALNLSEKQIANIALTVMGAIPGLVAILGVAQWWQRRS